MEERLFILSKAEAILALQFVNYVVAHATIDAKSDADGIYLEVDDFIKYIRAEDTPTLIRLLQRLRMYPSLDEKILEAITEQ